MSLIVNEGPCDTLHDGAIPVPETSSGSSDPARFAARRPASVHPFPRDVAELKRLVGACAHELRFADIRNDLRLPDDPALGTEQRVVDVSPVGFRLESGPRRHYLVDRHYRFDADEHTLTLLVDGHENGRLVVTRITRQAETGDAVRPVDG